MPDEPEEGFVVRDRRRIALDTPATPPEPVAPPTPPAPPTPTAETEDDDTPLDAAQFAALMNQMAQQQSLEAASDEEAGALPYEGEDGDTSIPDIYSVLVMFLHQMRDHSLLRLGLVPNPMTGESEQDLQQARVAIDTLGFLVTQIEPVIAPEERLPLRAMVSDLQVQYARQSQAGPQ